MPGPDFDDIYLELLRQRVWDSADQELRASGRKLTHETATPELLQPIIQQVASRHNVDPALVASVIQAESNFNSRAVSPKGAQGLMQLMPGTAAELGVKNTLDPEDNINGGTKYLAWLSKRYNGDIPKTLAAYNAGPGAVDRHNGIPPYPETQQYVRKIMAGYSGTGLPTGTLTVPKDLPDIGTGPDTGQRLQRGGGRPIQPQGQQQPERFRPTITRLTPAQQQMMQTGQIPEGQLRIDEPLTPAEAKAVAQTFVNASKEPQRQEVSFQRSGSQILTGAAGAAAGLIKSPLALGLVDEDTPAGQGLRKLAEPFKQVGETLKAADPTITDQVFQGIGSQLAFLVPSLGVSRGLQAMAGATRLMGVSATAANAIMEASAEASEAYDGIRGLVGDQEAQSRAQSVFWKNAALIAITDAAGMFNDALRPVLRGLTGAMMEGAQEGMQYDIGRRAFWVPADHEAAERLTQQGWVRNPTTDRIELPYSPENALTATAIGIFLGGGTGAALGAATPPETASAPAGDGSPASLLGYLLNERGSLGQPGEERQPSPEQMTLGGDIPPQTAFALPPSLAGAQVSMGQVPLQFADPLDQAMYIIGNPKTKSAQHEAYLQEVMDWLRAGENTVLAMAETRRNEIVAYARSRGQAGQTLLIPSRLEQTRTTATTPPTPAPRGQHPLPASTVRTPTGALLRVYHGTQGAFEQFDLERSGAGVGQERYGPGAYFTDSPTIAAEFAQEAGTRTPGSPAPNIRAAYLDIRQPFDIDAAPNAAIVTAMQRDLLAEAKRLKTGVPEAWQAAQFTTNGQVYTALGQFFADKAEVNEFLRTHGYDGITHRAGSNDQVWIAFDAAQVHPAATIEAQQRPAATPRATMPTEQLEMVSPLIGTDNRDMQGLPLVDNNAMQGLRDFLRMMEAERAQALEINGKPLEINYAHISTDDGVKQVLAAMSDIYAEQINAIRTPRSVEQTRTEAQKMGLTIDQFLQMDRENLVSRKKAIVAREMATASARQLKVATAMFKSGNMAGRDLLRTFAVHSAIQMQFARLANEAGGALQIFSAPVEGDLTSLKGFEKIMEYLGSQRISDEKLAALIDNTPTPEQMQLIVERAPTALAKDIFLNLWYGVWLLSNPKTFIVNMISTALAIPTGILERGIAGHLPGSRMPLETAMQRTLYGQHQNLTEAQRVALQANPSALYERDVEAGEATAMLYALWRSTGDAWRLAKKAFQTGESLFSEAQTAEGLERTLQGGYHRVSEDVRGLRYVGVLPVGMAAKAATFGPLAYFWDALGAVAQTSSNGLMAADEFFKTINYQMSAHAMAYRVAVQQGMAEGKPVSQVLDEMHKFIEKPPPDAEAVIIDEMGERTFTRSLEAYEGGLMAGLAQGIQRAADRAPILRLFIPFVRTGTNITYYNLERTPGVNLFVREVRRDLAAGGSRRDLALARMAMGGATALSVAMLGSLGLALVRGFGDAQPDERRAEEQVLGQQRYSWRIPFGDTHLSVSFFRLDPLSQFIGFMTDWASKAREVYASDTVQEWLEIGAAGIWALTKNITNRNYNQGIQDFMDLVQDDEAKDPEVTVKKWTRFVNQQASRFVPAGLGGIESALDPTMTEVGNAWEAFKSRIPFTEKTPVLDFWAEPFKQPHMTPLLDLFNPFPIQLEKRDPVTEELLHHGANLHGPSRVLEMPRHPQQGPEDEAIMLKPTEWNRLKTLFAKEVKDADGNDLRATLTDLMQTPEYQELIGGPNSGKTKALNQVIEAYKKMAKEQFLLEGMQPNSPYADVARKRQIAQGLRQARQTTPEGAQNVLKQLQDLVIGGGSR